MKKEIGLEEMAQISGGTEIKDTSVKMTAKMYCPVCKKETMFDCYSGGREICQECRKPKTFIL